MADFNQQPARTWTIFEHNKLQLHGEPWDKSNPKQRPSLSIHVFSNNPRFRVYMNDGRTQKPLAFKLPQLTMETIFSAINDFADRKDPGTATFALKDYRDATGRPMDKLEVVTSVTVGRGQDNVMFIALQAKGMEIVKFPFLTDFYSNVLGADGDPLDSAIASGWHSKGWVRLMSHLITGYNLLHAKKVERQEQTTGGGGGGNNWSGGGKPKAPSESFEDDVPSW